MFQWFETILKPHKLVASVAIHWAATMSDSAPQNPPNLPQLSQKDQTKAAWEKILEKQPDSSDIVIATKEEPAIFVSPKKTDGTSRLSSIATIPIAHISARLLRSLCSHYNIRGVSNKTKKEVCELLVAWKENGGKAATQDSGSPTKEPGKTKPKVVQANYFRLINILFMDKDVRSLYAAWNSQPSNDTLTKGQKHNQVLCEQILEIYNSQEPNDNADLWHHQHPTLDSSNEKLPATFEELPDWKRVFRMIQLLHKEYKAAQTGWKRSGSHSGAENVLEAMKTDLLWEEGDDTKDKFKINVDRTLYYFLFLQDNGGMFNAVAAFLPDGVEMDSGNGERGRSAAAAGWKKAGKRGNDARDCDGKSEVAGAIAGIGAAMMHKANIAAERSSAIKTKTLMDAIERQGAQIERLERKRDEAKKKYKRLKAAEEENAGSQVTMDSMDTTSGQCKEQYKKICDDIKTAQQVLVVLQQDILQKKPAVSTGGAKPAAAVAMTAKPAARVTPAANLKRKQPPVVVDDAARRRPGRNRTSAIDVGGSSSSDSDSSSDDDSLLMTPMPKKLKKPQTKKKKKPSSSESDSSSDDDPMTPMPKKSKQQTKKKQPSMLLESHDDSAEA